MDKTLILIGGGELRKKETLKIDAYIAETAKKACRGSPRLRLVYPDGKP